MGCEILSRARDKPGTQRETQLKSGCKAGELGPKTIDESPDFIDEFESKWESAATAEAIWSTSLAGDLQEHANFRILKPQLFIV